MDLIGWRTFMVVSDPEHNYSLFSPIKMNYEFNLWAVNEQPEGEPRPLDELETVQFFNFVRPQYNWYDNRREGQREIKTRRANTHGFFVFRKKANAVEYIHDKIHADAWGKLTSAERYGKLFKSRNPKHAGTEVIGMVHATVRCLGDVAYCQPTASRPALVFGQQEQEGFRAEKIEVLGLYSSQPSSIRRVMAHNLGWPKVLPIAEGQEKFPINLGGK